MSYLVDPGINPVLNRASIPPVDFREDNVMVMQPKSSLCIMVTNSRRTHTYGASQECILRHLFPGHLFLSYAQPKTYMTRIWAETNKEIKSGRALEADCELKPAQSYLC